MQTNELKALLKRIEIDGVPADFNALAEAAEDSFKGELFVVFGPQERYLWLVLEDHASLGDTPLSSIDEELLEVANAIADLFGM